MKKVDRYEDDNLISDWAKDDVYLNRILGLMVGDHNNFFNPKANFNREQAASVMGKLYRWLMFRIPNMIQRVKKSIIVITNSYDGKRSLGSGTIINPEGLILTNYHCVADSKGDRKGEINIKVLTEPSSTSEEKTKTYPGAYIVGEQFLDIALIKIDFGQDSPYVEIAKENPFEGEPIQVFGHPLALEYTTSAGQITQDMRSVSFRGMIQTDAPINPGNSGGAAVSELSKKLVGVPTLKRMDGEGIGYLIPPEVIRAFLERHEKVIKEKGGSYLW